MPNFTPSVSVDAFLGAANTAAMLAALGMLPGAHAIPIYVDSRAANDAGTGLLPTSPKKTIAAAVSLLVEGGELRLARSGIWRETVNLIALGDVTLEAYGAGASPIIDGSQIVTTWTLESGIVWKCDVTLEAGAANRAYPFVFEDNTRLKEVVDSDAASLAARIALVQATPGSFYFAGPGNYTSGWSAGVKTFYISASDSGNPNSNGELYTVNARIYALIAANATLRDIHIRRMFHHDGLSMGPTSGGILERVTVSDYGRHGIIDPHSVHRECLVYGGNPRFPGGAYHFYKSALTEMDASYYKCRAIGVKPDGFAQGTGWFGHGPSPGVTRVGGRVVIEDCEAIGLAEGYGGSDTNYVDLIRCKTRWCNIDVGAGAFINYNILDCDFRGAWLSSIATNGAGRTTTIKRSKIATAITSDNAAILWNQGASGPVVIEDCEFSNTGQQQPNGGQPWRFLGAVDALRVRNTALMSVNGSFGSLLAALSVATYDIPDDELVTSLPLLFTIGGSNVATSALSGSGVGRIQQLQANRFYAGTPLTGDWTKRPGTQWPPVSGTNALTFNKNSGNYLFPLLGGKSLIGLEVGLGGNTYYTPSAELFGAFTIFSPRTFVMVGAGGLIVRSDVGFQNWSPVTSGTANTLRAGAGVTGVAIAVGDTGTIRRSTDDGATWAAATTPAAGVNHLYGAAFGASAFVAVGAAGTIVSSTDGNVFTSRTSGATETLRALAFGNNLFVAVGNAGIIRTSPDGTTWTARTSNTLRNFTAVDYGDGRWTAVCQDNTRHPGDIYTSTDGIAWTPVAFDLPFEPTSVIYGGPYGGPDYWWLIAGRSNSVAISYDGLTWRTHAALRPDLINLQNLDISTPVRGVN